MAIPSQTPGKSVQFAMTLMLVLPTHPRRRGMTGMSDRNDIQQVINTYSVMASQGRVAEMAATYAADGIWAVPGIGLEVTGHAAIIAAAAAVTDKLEYIVQMNSPAVIKVEGDRASAQTVVRECGKYAGKQVALEVLGLYDDVLVRTDVGWRFARRNFILRGMHDVPISPPSLHNAG
jgi:ketosteroid isomerase-like protein